MATGNFAVMSVLLICSTFNITVCFLVYVMIVQRFRQKSYKTSILLILMFDKSDYYNY